MRSLMQVGAAVVMVALMASCRSIEVDSTEWLAVERDVERTWAWASGNPDEDPIDREISKTLELALKSRGLKQVPPTKASFLVSFKSKVQTDIRALDPYWSYHAAEQYEMGHIKVELLNPANGIPVWTGEAAS